MNRALKLTWIALGVATALVVASGALIVRRFVSHVMVDCRGALVAVAPSELSDAKRNDHLPASDLDVKWDVVQTKLGEAYENVRVVWARSDTALSCADVPLTWHPSSSVPISPAVLSLQRDDVTGLYIVRDDIAEHRDVAVFRKIDDRGHRLVGSKLVDGQSASFLVFLVALGALAFGATRAVRATPYATRMHAWRVATLRPDGLLESETGATLGKLDPGARVPAGPVLVDAGALEGRDVYREMPILVRRQVAVGTHERWAEGTARRLRDARSLAILSGLTTVVAMAAHLSQNVGP